MSPASTSCRRYRVYAHKSIAATVRKIFAPLVTVVIAACAGQSQAPGSGAQTAGNRGTAGTCGHIRVLDTRVGQPTAFSITTAFVATDCGGAGIGGLTTDKFEIQENGKPIVAKESAAVILPRSAEPYLTVVLDNTPTVRTSGAVDALVDGALALVDSLGTAAPSARVAVVWFSLKTDVKQDFTNDFAKAKAAIEAYRTADVGTPSTNLYGAIIDSINLSQTAQLNRRKAQRDGILTMGNVVVFTDGADNAAISTLAAAQEATSATKDEVQMVGLKTTDELDLGTFEKLGNTKAIIAKSAAELKSAFLAKAAQIASLSAGTYVLGYCTPKAAGTHQLTIAIPGKGKSDPVPFDASGFVAQGGPACGVAAFEAACGGLECGGLWCGGCAQTCTEAKVCQCEGGFAGKSCDQCQNPKMALPGCATCKPEFAGADCGQCSDPHRALPDCGACLPKFSGAECKACADAKFVGAECDQCAVEGMSAPECAVCKAAFSGSKCDECSNANKNLPGCKTCKSEFAGAECQECANPNMVLPGCTACKPEFTGPSCESCVNAKMVAPACTTCTTAFAGAACDQCANPNMAVPGCATCKPEFAGDKCDICANGNMAMPACTGCKAEFKGSACDMCANEKFAPPECKSCAKNSMTGSECSLCKPEFSGTGCDSCANPKMSLPSCTTCKLPWAGTGCEECSISGNAGTMCDQVNVFVKDMTLYGNNLSMKLQGSNGFVMSKNVDVLAALYFVVPPGSYTMTLTGGSPSTNWSGFAELYACGAFLTSIGCSKFSCAQGESVTTKPFSLKLCGGAVAACKPETCNDANACTTDGCSAAGACENKAVADTTNCGTGMACTAGICKGTTAVCDPAKCSDNNPCTSDGCNGAGACESKPIADGTACGSGLTCKAGMCAGASGGAHFCDANCGKPGKNCYCDADCAKFGDCCNAAGSGPDGKSCTGSTCAACK